jgi:hypothetical protein
MNRNDVGSFLRKNSWTFISPASLPIAWNVHMIKEAEGIVAAYEMETTINEDRAIK